MIYIISGVPRSFTTCMMKALHAGGLPAVKSYQRDQVGKSLSRSNYEPNPNGELWEPNLEDVKQLGFPRQYDGHVIKVLATWLPAMAVHEYRAVFLLRNPAEVYQSFKTMLEGSKYTEQFITQEQQEGMAWLKNRRDVLSTSVFSTDQLLKDPLWVFQQLRNDGWPIDPVAASKLVEPRRKRAVA